jgi:hypothetical protein
MLRCLFLLAVCCLGVISLLNAQDRKTGDIHRLIDNYSLARENRDTVLLKKILTDDIDQLVSSGEWRYGLRSAVQGMLESSAARPGTRTLRVERVRFLTKKTAIADARYEIKNPDGSVRTMWSSFTLWQQKDEWKIAAIRNMLPASAR